MTAANHHLVEVGDQPQEDLAICKARGCGWTFRHKSRQLLLAASYQHVANATTPKETSES